MEKRIVVMCAELNGEYVAVDENGFKMNYWKKNEVPEGATFPMSQHFLKGFNDSYGKNAYELQIVKDPGGSEPFIKAVKQYEENPLSKNTPEPAGEKKIEEITLDLPVELTEEKELEIFRKMNTLLNDVDKLELERDRTNKAYKADIADVEKDVSVLRDQLKNKPMGRVVCTAHKIDGKIVSVFRNDTGEEVDGVCQTALPLEEMQTDMSSTPIDEADAQDIDAGEESEI